MRDYKNNKIHTVRTTNLTSSRTSDDYDKDYYSIKGGYYYILEVARKVTPENKAKFALDERRIICGHERIVSVHRLYVSRIVYENKRYVLQCVGTNRCGQRVDGTYFFYQTPIFSDDRDNFILSIIPDDRSLKNDDLKESFLTMTNELLDSTTINKIAEIFDKERENGRATGKNFNLLEIMEIEHKETKICLVLRNLLDPKGSHCQGSFFLERFCRMVLNLDESELPHEKLNTARVIKEYSIYGSNRRIDIVIITSNHFIPIEVKIGASDEKEQCYDYYMETSNRIGKDAVVFYLTPNGKAPYKNSSMDLSVTDKYGKGKIRCISFKDDITAFLLECINDESICSNPRLCDSLTQLLDTVGKFSQNDLSGNLLKNIKDVIPKEITSESLSDNRKKFFLTKTLNRFKQKENLIEKDARIIDEIISSHNWKYCISDDIGKTSNGESIAIFITVDVHESNAYWGITLATCKGKPDDDKLLRRKKGDPKVKAIINEKIREHYGRINTWVFKEQRLKIMNPDSINFYRLLISDEMEDFIEEVVFDVDRIFKKYRSINDTD